MNNSDIAQSVFTAVDQRDAEKFATFLLRVRCFGLQIKTQLLVNRLFNQW
jgi:hypothetical protein